MYDQTPEMNELTGKIIKCAMQTHTLLGPGLLEKAYEEALCYFLIKEGLKIERQKEIGINLQEVKLDCGFRIDLLVEDFIILEIKSMEKLLPIHQAQIMTYLKLSDLNIGFLMNFNVQSMRDGLRRIIHSDKTPRNSVHSAVQRL